MVTLGVSGEKVLAGRRLFGDYPSVPELSLTGRLGEAPGMFARAWGGADAAVHADAAEFGARLGRSVALYAEAEGLVSSAVRGSP